MTYFCCGGTDTWGEAFPPDAPRFDLILATDILLCKKYRTTLFSSLLEVVRQRETGRQRSAVFIPIFLDAIWFLSLSIRVGHIRSEYVYM